ncbi:methyltransferase domain-containing protein, partial [Methylobacterium trifolii]
MFSQIYARGLWIEAQGQESLSGAGSTQSATRDLVGSLSAILAQVECRHLVDIGCGDFNWMRRVEGDFAYTGIDVVPSVIAQNARLYGDARRRFLCLDATREPIPAGDVALCREVLFHLSSRHGLRLLSNIKRAGVRYVVLTDEADTRFNGDITSGGFRKRNLAEAPYRLPAPMLVPADDNHGRSKGRALGVWPAAA